MTKETNNDSFAPDLADAIMPATAGSRTNGAWIEAMTSVGGELAAFVAERFQQDLALQ